MYILCPEVPEPGFSFANCKRNAVFDKRGIIAPKPTKTGTTIVGVVFNDGVVLGADTRATDDTIVAEKYSEKIHYIAPNMYCCGAGTAADTEQTTRRMSSQLELHSLYTNRPARVCTAMKMLQQYLFKYQGHIGAALILGGVDVTGNHLYSIHPHGSVEKVPYTTMGSGSIAAMSVIESRWKPDISEQEAVQLVRDAVASGIYNDLGSGNNVDLCILRKDGGVDYRRPHEVANTKGEKVNKYTFRKGITSVLSTKVEVIDVTVHPVEPERMDIA